ncbi:MAG: sigma-70 family RNA polymerase sigma factor [Phycisphaerae bacterium]|nr:sigma-70 family RNA polymerase sigma factor [Phycisphaerales bacterium]
MTQDEQVERAVRGDQDALSELLKGFGPIVRSDISQQIGAKYRPALDDDDVMSVTYCEAFLGISRLVPATMKAFESWFRRIAKNNLLDAIRELNAAARPPRSRMLQPRDSQTHRHATLLAEIVGDMTTASLAMRRKENRELLDKAIHRLPPDYRLVIEMYELNDEPVEEVAKMLKRSKGAVYMIRARALERLRDLIPATLA